MCYNQSVSWTAFIIGTIINVILIVLFMDNWMIVALALFFQFVVTVQLFEALSWRGQKELGANGILVLTLCQPIFLGMILLFVSEVDPPLKLISGFILFLYIMWVIYSLNNISNFTSLEKGVCNHLDYSFWKDMGSIPYFIVALLIAAILIKPASLAITFIVALFITLGLAMVFYNCKDETASLWCLTSVLVPIVILIYALIEKQMLKKEDFSDL